MYKHVKCKKCRKSLFPEINTADLFINAHADKVQQRERETSECPSIQDEKLLFLHEDFIPEWISSNVETEQWQKGKINCPHCDARIGAFDFTTGMKCECAFGVLPAVHLIKSKVDCVKDVS